MPRNVTSYIEKLRNLETTCQYIATVTTITFQLGHKELRDQKSMIELKVNDLSNPDSSAYRHLQIIQLVQRWLHIMLVKQIVIYVDSVTTVSGLWEIWAHATF